MINTFTEENYQELISWIDSPEILLQFAGPKYIFPLTEEQLREDLADPFRFAFTVCIENSQEIIGHAQLYVKPQSISLGRIILKSEEYRGKGLGRLLVNELLSFGFSNFEKQMAELNVYDWNLSAIKCYESVGFKFRTEGKSEVQIGNKTWVSRNMILYREDFSNF